MPLPKQIPFFRLLTTCIALILLLSSIAVHAQDIPITGKVLSSEGNTPLQGASVVIKGTATGTTTNAEGAFQINVPDKNTILVLTNYNGFVLFNGFYQNGNSMIIHFPSAVNLFAFF